MPNKIAGNVLTKCRAICRYIHQRTSNSINYYLINELGLPFNIHYSCEFRTPAQIFINYDCTIKSRTILNGRSNLRKHGIILGPDTYLKENCYLDAYGGYIEIEGQCAFAQNTVIHGGGGVSIGRNVILGANCYIISSNHNFASKELPIMLQGDTTRGITIGNNVWLGGNVIVLDGVSIGNNCVIGAGTIVRKNIPSGMIVYDKRHSVTREVYHA